MAAYNKLNYLIQRINRRITEPIPAQLPPEKPINSLFGDRASRRTIAFTLVPQFPEQNQLLGRPLVMQRHPAKGGAAAAGAVAEFAGLQSNVSRRQPASYGAKVGER